MKIKIQDADVFFFFKKKDKDSHNLEQTQQYNCRHHILF